MVARKFVQRLMNRRETALSTDIEVLISGPIYRFADWPIRDVPSAPGVYTIWRLAECLYVGMAGRNAQSTDASSKARKRPYGLRSRLGSHASGRRSGDQFCVYACDRLIVPGLNVGELASIGTGKLSLDRMTRDLVRRTLVFRFVVSVDGATALRTETEFKLLRQPLLNP